MVEKYLLCNVQKKNKQKKTAGYWFAFFMKLHEKESILCDFLPAKKHFFSSLTFRCSHKQTTGMKLCAWILYSVLFHLKKNPFWVFFIHTPSQNKHITFCTSGRGMSPFESWSFAKIEEHPNIMKKEREGERERLYI